MNRKSRHSFATSFVVAVALSLGSVVAAHAGEITVKYSLSAGTQTGVIRVPANTPVQLIGDQTVIGDIGVAPTRIAQCSGRSSAMGRGKLG